MWRLMKTNTYGYASQNPLRWRDPLGLFDLGNSADAILNVFSTAGNGEYYGAAVGGSVGLVAGARFGVPGAIGGSLFGAVIGGTLGYVFDDLECAGALNCQEVVPLVIGKPTFGSCTVEDPLDNPNNTQYPYPWTN